MFLFMKLLNVSYFVDIEQEHLLPDDDPLGLKHVGVI